MWTKTSKLKNISAIVAIIALVAFTPSAEGFFFGKNKPTAGQPTKEDLTIAAQIKYEITNLHHSLIDEEKAEANIIVPLGLSKEQITSVCRSAFADIEKQCKTKLKKVTLNIFHENSVAISKGGFTCARFILDLTGVREQPESVYFNDYYFMNPQEYRIESISQDQAIKLWHDLIRAERQLGVGTTEYKEAETKLYKKYGLEKNNSNMTKLSNWAVVDGFGLPD